MKIIDILFSCLTQFSINQNILTIDGFTRHDLGVLTIILNIELHLTYSLSL